MRMILLVGLMSMAGSAQAGSIDVIRTSNSERSIDYVRCPDCAPLKVKEKEEVPDVVLAPGTQLVEVKKVDGVLKVFRTEAWLGGSPVTYVSKASTDLIDDTGDKTADKGDAVDPPVAIDQNTTSAVTADMSDAKPEAAKNPVALANEPAVAMKPVLTPEVADMSNGASATVAKPMSKPFDPQSIQLRLRAD
jgi:hypothetical protein